jgi:cytochrome c-type biogenesis protein CcmH/NrfF
LWLGPAAVLLVGACGLLVLARRYRTGLNRATAEEEKVTPAEAARPSEI